MSTDEKTPEVTEPEVPETPEEAVETSPEPPSSPEAPPEGYEPPPEEPVDELLVGELLPQEMMTIQQIKGRINQGLLEIGHMEARKAAILDTINNLEQQGQKVVQDARVRLGISEEFTLQVTPDGKMRRLPEQERLNNVVPLRPPGAPGTPPQG